jgi:hypothetical protein
MQGIFKIGILKERVGNSAEGAAILLRPLLFWGDAAMKQTETMRSGLPGRTSRLKAQASAMASMESHAGDSNG